MDLLRILLVIIIAAIAYYVITPLAGAPVFVGAIAALLILLIGLVPQVRGRL